MGATEEADSGASPQGWPIGRRTAVGGLSVAALAAVAWALLRTPDSPLVRGLRRQLGDDRGLAEAAAAASDALRAHRRAWSETRSVVDGLGDESFDRAADAIRRGCRDDYREGRVLPVLGWRIARTEAELLALLA